MTRVEGETVIARTPETVFDYVADERHEPDFNPRMLRVEKLTDGPVDTGTEFLATTSAWGRPVSMLIEITDYQRPSRLSSTTHMSSADVRGELTFEPDGTGTRMHWSWDVQPKGLARLAGPWVGRFGRHQEEHIWTARKERLESDGAG